MYVSGDPEIDPAAKTQVFISLQALRLLFFSVSASAFENLCNYAVVN